VGDTVEDNYFVYLWKVLPSIPSKLSWLWFLIALFVVMILNYPLMAWTQRRKMMRPFDWRHDGKVILG